MTSPGSGGILVTGGSGFIGTHVVKALIRAGHRVCVLDVRRPDEHGRFVIGDALDHVAFEEGSVADAARVLDVVRRHRPRHVVHLGTIIDPAYLACHRSTGFSVNVQGTVNVVEAMLAFEVERLVLFSSVGVLPAPQYEPIDTAHPLVLPDRGPGTAFYGAHKAACELLCFAYHDALGLDFRVVRPSAVYGLGMNRFPGPIQEMVEGSVRGERLRFESGGLHRRDYTHVDDIAGLVLALLAAPESADRVFFGATGQPLVSGSELAQVVMDVIPDADIRIEDRLTDEEAPIAAMRGQLSVDNARGQLRWEPRYASVRDGVRAYADSYRAFIDHEAR